MLRLLASILFATASTSHALCLHDGIGPENRTNITVRGASMPVGIVSFNWASSLIEVEVYRIIVEEALGFHAALALFGSSVQGFFKISGCSCGPNGDCFGADPTCDPRLSHWHISLGHWDSYDLSAKTYVTNKAPEQYPEDLGSLGYAAWDAMFVTKGTVDEAFARVELPLEYYRAYNTSQDLTQFFASVEEIPQNRLMTCDKTRFTYSDEIDLYLRFTSDWEGVVLDDKGLYSANCSHGDRWWLAPSCRHDVRSCIPFVTGGGGWAVLQQMLKAAIYHIPLAMAVAATGGEYESIPYDFTTSFYWWYPDALFTIMEPIAVAFPPHNPEEWAQGNSRTTTRGDFIKKYAWYGLHQVAGERFREVARGMAFTSQTMDRLLQQFVQLHVSGGKSQTEAGYDVACDWLRQNKQTWHQWVPLRTNCVEGQGLVLDGSVLGSFVFTRAEASSCQWCSTGRFSSPITDADGGTFICLPCPSGTTQRYSAQASCRNCTAGRFKAHPSADTCFPCPPGRANHQPGQTECAECPPGRISSRAGEKSCMDCNNGTFAPSWGLLSCLFCSAGRYAATSGASKCALCEDVIAGSTNYRGSASKEECTCPLGSYMALKDGCLACPSGLMCPGGNEEPLQLPGFWVDLSQPSARTRSYAAHTYRCRDEQQCPQGPLGSCAAHRNGMACNNCEDRHFPMDGGDCAPCTSSSALPFAACLVGLPLLMVAVLFLARFDASKQHLSIVTVGCITGQLVMSMQTLSAIQKVQIEFPRPLADILDFVVMLTSFDLLHLPCVLTTDTPVTRFAVMLLAYPFFAAILFSGAWIIKRLGRPFDAAVLLNANGLMVLFAYITMTLQVLLPFQCQENPGGFWSMVTEPGLKCFNDADHIMLSVLGVVGILGYPVAITAFVGYATWSFRLNVGNAERLSRLKGYRFIFARFKPERFYFGLVLLVRNCLVALVPILLVRLPGLQVLGLILVLLLASILQALCWPWRTELANAAELILCVGLTFVGAGVGILLCEADSELASMVGWTISGLISLLLLTALVAVLRLLNQRIRPKKRFGIFLCHHKAGAGVLCRLLKTLMASRSSPIFLDSDHLDDLDSLFDIVRTSVSNLVVVLSQAVLSRPWCAGEIATAHCNNVNIAVLLCEDFSRPDHAALQELVHDWSEDEFSLLASYDISRQMVFEAYCHVLATPYVSLSRFQDLTTKQAIVMQLITETCQVRGRGSLKSVVSRTASKTGPKRPVVVVTGAINEGEWLAACELMQVLLEQYLEVETEVLRDTEVQVLPATAKIVVVILSQGLMRDPVFAKTLLAITDPVEDSFMLPHLLTVQADGSFQFPGVGFYIELEKAGLGLPDLGPAEGARLATAYHSMLSTLSRPFTPLASERTIQAQVVEIGNRARQLLKQPFQTVKSLPTRGLRSQARSDEMADFVIWEHEDCMCI